MKTAIVYRSILGTSRVYAEWLAQDLSAEIIEMKSASAEILKNYGRVIVISGTYMGQMAITGYLKKNWDVLKDRQVVAVGVGTFPSKHNESIKSYMSIPEDIRSGIKYFKLPGKIFGIMADLVKRENVAPIIEYLGNE